MIGRVRFVASTCAVIVAAVAVHPTATTAATPAMHQPAVAAVADVDVTLRALARLHDFGYTVNTSARADRAIRHWQRVNGLAVDGIVGPQTVASLGMSPDATATNPAVRDNLPPGSSVEDVVRFVWPDQLEDRAVRIAFRESRLVPTARNACCFGLFQINWSAHRAWLADIGVTAPAQLLDAGTNARAALALFERDGWRPWAL